MSHGYPADSPTVRRHGRAIGFSPSPNGCSIRAWWTQDGNPIGTYSSFEEAVQAGLEALGCEDPAEVERETARIATEFHEVDWR
ncbi:hypothetical protein [Rhodococcus sp. NCIMB 12038]|uniref:hypothetical protein n=1 Tax=Rhodococcus sp. NCIMB 12038 TaxID=933800 RepID=UPI000B3CD16C|nr:hypothetical protein [Rhodococcus sp. NCIMB 12038]OUS97393.1 hypothetical protein CA951_03360 [Rhodococcus sp. NCIMB 12038]